MKLLRIFAMAGTAGAAELNGRKNGIFLFSPLIERRGTSPFFAHGPGRTVAHASGSDKADRRGPWQEVQSQRAPYPALPLAPALQLVLGLPRRRGFDRAQLHTSVAHAHDLPLALLLDQPDGNRLRAAA